MSARFEIAIVPNANPNADSRWVEVAGDFPSTMVGSKLWVYLNSLAPDDHFVVLYRQGRSQNEHEAGDKSW